MTTEEVPNTPTGGLSQEELETIGNGLQTLAQKLHALYGPVATTGLLMALAINYTSNTQSDWHAAKLLKCLSLKLATSASRPN